MEHGPDVPTWRPCRARPGVPGSTHPRERRWAHETVAWGFPPPVEPGAAVPERDEPAVRPLERPGRVRGRPPGLPGPERVGGGRAGLRRGRAARPGPEGPGD